MVSLKKAKELADNLGVNLQVVPLKEWRYAIQIELEHGTIIPISNVTNDNLLMTAKIALAHLLEYPDYYTRLKKMEHEAHTYWQRRKKPSILHITRKKSTLQRKRRRKTKKKSTDKR